MIRVTSFLLTALAAAAAAQAQLVRPPATGGETPRADVSRKAPSAAVSAGPGTQTEDDIVIGRKLNGEAVSRATAKPLVVAPTPVTVPAAPAATRSPSALLSGRTRSAKPPAGQVARATGDEDEMDDLDVQRRKAQGLPDNKPASPKGGVRAGGESPQTERR